MISPDQAERRKGPNYERVLQIGQPDEFLLPDISARKAMRFLTDYMNNLGPICGFNLEGQFGFNCYLIHDNSPYIYTLSLRPGEKRLSLIFGLEDDKRKSFNDGQLCLEAESYKVSGGIPEKKVRVWKGTLKLTGANQGPLIREIIERLSEYLKSI